MIKRGSEMPSVLVPAVCLLENWCRTGADKVWTAKVKRRGGHDQQCTVSRPIYGHDEGPLEVEKEKACLSCK